MIVLGGPKPVGQNAEQTVGQKSEQKRELSNMYVNNEKNKVSPAPELDRQADGPAGRLLLTRSVFVTYPLPVQTESSSCLRPHLEAQEPFTGAKNAVGLLY